MGQALRVGPGDAAGTVVRTRRRRRWWTAAVAARGCRRTMPGMQHACPSRGPILHSMRATVGGVRAAMRRLSSVRSCDGQFLYFLRERSSRAQRVIAWCDHARRPVTRAADLRTGLCGLPGGRSVLHRVGVPGGWTRFPTPSRHRRARSTTATTHR